MIVAKIGSVIKNANAKTKYLNIFGWTVCLNQCNYLIRLTPPGVNH